MTLPSLTVREVRARPVIVPLRRPLVTAGGTVDRAYFVLVDLATEEGVTGCAYLFCPGPLGLKPTAATVQGMSAPIAGDALAPVAIERKLRRHLGLLGATGIAGMALSGIDMAAWDALAKAAGAPLVRLLGGAARPIVAYNSNGLGLMGPVKAAAEAAELIEDGFPALKIRLGYASAAEDLAVVRAVRKAVPARVALMADYNQCLLVAEAQARGRALDDEGLLWIEEPTRAEDHAGNATVAREVRTPIQIGENFWGPRDMYRAVAAGASDLVMPDVMRIGGVTGWLAAAGIAEAHGIPMSSHMFPEASAHLMCVTPTAHWLEYFDWADPILEQPFAVRDGHLIVPDRPGLGMAWNEKAVARFAA